MLQLIIKDFRANWIYQLPSLIILLIFSTVYTLLMLEASNGIEPELFVYILLVVLSISSVSLLFLIQDTLFKTDEVFVSLPVSRREVVLAKYATSFLQLAFALSAHFLGFHLGMMIQGGSARPELEIIANPRLWFSILYVLLLFKSYAFPLYFKFGLAIGSVIHGAIQFLLIITVILSVKASDVNAFINNTTIWLSNQNTFFIIMLLVGAIILIMTGSMIASINIFKNKEI